MTEATIAEDLLLEPAEMEPSIIYKGYLSTVEEVVEHVQAADTLGLGFRVESYLVASTEEPGSSHGEFEFVLFGEIPVRQEED